MRLKNLIFYNQNGATLIIGMLTLAFLTLIGVFATTSSNLETKSASTDRNYKVSFYAAELGLQVAETSIEDLLSRRDFSENTISGHYGQGQQPDGRIGKKGAHYAAFLY